MTTIAMAFSYLYSAIILVVMGFLAVHFFKAKETKKIVVACVIITSIIAIKIYPVFKQAVVIQNWIGYLLCVLYSILIGSTVSWIIGFIFVKLKRDSLLGLGAISGIYAGLACIFVGIAHFLGIMAIFSTFESIVYCIGGIVFLIVGISMAKDGIKQSEKNKN